MKTKEVNQKIVIQKVRRTLPKTKALANAVSWEKTGGGTMSIPGGHCLVTYYFACATQHCP